MADIVSANFIAFAIVHHHFTALSALPAKPLVCCFTAAPSHNNSVTIVLHPPLNVSNIVNRG